MLDVPGRSLPDGRPDVFVDIPNCKYSETLAYYDVKSDYFVGENVTISSDTEIVLVLDYVHAIPGYQAGTLNLFALSESRMYFAEKGNWYLQGAWQDHGSTGKIDFTTGSYDNSDYQYFKILSAATTSSSEALEYAFMTGKMKVFSTADDAMNYLETGDTINNDVNNYVGNNTSSETNKNFIEKFLGFFQLLENNSFLGVWGKVFGWLPPGISSVITTALGIGACVGLFKFFRK